MKPALEDYLILYSDRIVGEAEKFLRSASRDTVQAWIDEHLSPGMLLQVRRISLDEFSRDVTDEFREPVEEDACPSRSGRADHDYRMIKELA